MIELGARPTRRFYNAAGGKKMSRITQRQRNEITRLGDKQRERSRFPRSFLAGSDYYLSAGALSR